MTRGTGKILDIDLSTGKVSTSEVDEDVMRKYIGGSGLAAKLFFDRVSPNVDPLAAGNVFFLMAGPLSGTLLPATSRFAISFKSPLTGIWGEAGGGGDIAPAMKKAGYDGMAISGVSDKPVYISIVDDKVEIKDALSLWGKDVYETVDMLKGKEGKNSSVVCIGQAGENLVRIAAVANGKHSFAARTGGGAVMGSKKLKAIVVTGTGKIDSAKPDELKTLRKDLINKVNDSMTAKMLKAQGTIIGMDAASARGGVPLKNYSLGDAKKIASKVNAALLTKKYLTSNYSCHSCPISCKRVVRIDEGSFKMDEGAGPEYETAGAFGPLIMNDDLGAVVKLNELCNRYGVDTISCGAVIAFAMECFEKGIITSDDLGGGELRWGNTDDIFKIFNMIVFRKCIGDVLAKGVKSAAKKIGKGAEKFTAEVKGLEQSMHDARAMHGLGLHYMMCNRGACHVASYVVEAGMCTYPEIGLKGPYTGMNSRGKADMVYRCENLNMVANSSIICQMSLVCISVNDLIDMLNCVTGFDYNIDEFEKCGKRIWMLKRGLNNLMGVTKADDRMTERMLTAYTEGAAAGSVPDVQLMLEEYYNIRGLDNDGKPLKEVMERLDLFCLAEKL
jgi:aldehyde:ferredoxin oxidoreductase